MSNADELRKLSELLNDGLLTQEEFEKEKKKLLNNEIKDDLNEKNYKVKKEEFLSKKLEKRNKVIGYIVYAIIFAVCYNFIDTAYEEYPADENWYYCVDEVIKDGYVYCPNGDVFKFKFGFWSLFKSSKQLN